MIDTTKLHMSEITHCLVYDHETFKSLFVIRLLQQSSSIQIRFVVALVFLGYILTHTHKETCGHSSNVLSPAELVGMHA